MMKSYDKIAEAQKIFDKNDYVKKVARLKDKLTEEYRLWKLKSNYENRLRDVEKDIQSIKPLINKTQFEAKDKALVDRLYGKYNME